MRRILIFLHQLLACLYKLCHKTPYFIVHHGLYPGSIDHGMARRPDNSRGSDSLIRLLSDSCFLGLTQPEPARPACLACTLGSACYQRRLELPPATQLPAPRHTSRATHFPAHPTPNPAHPTSLPTSSLTLPTTLLALPTLLLTLGKT